MATGSDQCRQQVAIFRTRCQTLQLHVYTQRDSDEDAVRVVLRPRGGSGGDALGERVLFPT